MATRILRTGSAARRGQSLRGEQTPAAPASQSRLTAPSKTERGGGYVRTSASRGKSVYDETDQEVEVLRATFPEGVEPAHVQVGAGMTVNLGNYESLRIDCVVRLPCLPTRLDETYDTAAQFVADKIAEEQARWLGQGNTKQRR